MIEKIVSGGQTGVDRAALDVAIKLNISHGGWCPKGRLAELDVTIPTHYQLKETDSDDYSERTKLNIRYSDGTLILIPATSVKIIDGTILTIQEVKDKKKPFLIIDLSENKNIELILNWIKEYNIKVLNIAGPRESHYSGIYQKSFDLLKNVFYFLLSQRNEASKGTTLTKAKL